MVAVMIAHAFPCARAFSVQFTKVHIGSPDQPHRHPERSRHLYAKNLSEMRQKHFWSTSNSVLTHLICLSMFPLTLGGMSRNLGQADVVLQAQNPVVW